MMHEGAAIKFQRTRQIFPRDANATWREIIVASPLSPDSLPQKIGQGVVKVCQGNSIKLRNEQFDLTTYTPFRGDTRSSRDIRSLGHKG